MSFGPEINEGIYELLKKKYEKIGISSFCCAKPSEFIKGTLEEKEILNKRMSEIKNMLLKNEVKEIYAACPNCLNILREKLDIKVKSVWPIIDELFPKEKKDILKGKRFIIHDPCVSKDEKDVHNSIRNILSKLGVEIVEFKNNKEKSSCCGQKNMTMIFKPKEGKKILKHKIDSMGEEKQLVTYCATCVSTFRSENVDSFHILELLFSKKSSSSWINRLKVSSRIK